MRSYLFLGPWLDVHPPQSGSHQAGHGQENAAHTHMCTQRCNGRQWKELWSGHSSGDTCVWWRKPYGRCATEWWTKSSPSDQERPIGFATHKFSLFSIRIHPQDATQWSHYCEIRIQEKRRRTYGCRSFFRGHSYFFLLSLCLWPLKE